MKFNIRQLCDEIGPRHHRLVSTPTTLGHRAVRSFVRRDSRMTVAQKAALASNWANYALPACDTSEGFAEAFGRAAPLTLEVGSGDGDCVFTLARRQSEENFVAVEVYRPGLGRLLHRAAAANTSNIRVSDADVYDLLEPISEAVFDRILVFFPDPWPKKRHFKRRLMQAPFFDLIESRLHRHGRLLVATDCASYAESILETVSDLPGWVNLAGPRRSAPRAALRPITRFERKAIAAGSKVYDLAFARR